MNYTESKEILRLFYDINKLNHRFEEDNLYLETAFNEINKIWLENLSQIKTVNYIMIAEAPLWGKDKQYIYNPETNNSQFFYRSDLEVILNKKIPNKIDFIQVCNEIGLLVMDISPFALNSNDTKINYGRNYCYSKKLRKPQYRDLVRHTIPTFFEEKIKIIQPKKSPDIKTFFRYKRVKNTFEDIISTVLIDYDIIKNQKDIGDISQIGGGIDKIILGEIIKVS